MNCLTDETLVTDDTRPPNAKDYVWPNLEDEGREGIIVFNRLIEWSIMSLIFITDISYHAN